MEFLLGCNYWASNAGTDMWKDFDIDIIDKDLSLLSQNGIKYLRVFPNWRDFQPSSPMMSNRGVCVGYTGDKKNHYLNNTMLDRFGKFLDACGKYGIKVIVGLITGFMSGAMLIPPALYNKNIITDSVSQYFQQLYIKGFVSHFKNRAEILAWDLGNECNEMESVKSPYEAATWTAMVSNAIRANDNSRPVVSGMHYLDNEDNWKITDQAENCDILTTHPYPYWCEGTTINENLSLRTIIFPTVYTKYYEAMSGKPCLAEEMGTMGPMVCSDEASAKFLRVNLFSLWANGAAGAMWWCSNDQTELNHFPYSMQMVERELGLLRNDCSPKPTLLEIKRFYEFLSSFNIKLPRAKDDAVCLLTHDQHHWSIAYMTYVLARKAGLNISFADANEEIPDSPIYIVPSIKGVRCMFKDKYDMLKERVKNGATLYLSLDNGILSEFEELCGVKVVDSFTHKTILSTNLNGEKIELEKSRNLTLEITSAEIIAYDSENNPFITVNSYGKGKVYLVNAPIEANLIDKRGALDSNIYKIYKAIFEKEINSYIVKSKNDNVLLTLHEVGNGYIVVAINYGGSYVGFDLSIDIAYKIDKFYYGNSEKIAPYDACIFKITK
ncbi:MAG: cellulase family glycosylhydrolase [Clostridia bacterium]|nr:cellulase family glycosylhydrolase [Clostridia bacterium]